MDGLLTLQEMDQVFSNSWDPSQNKRRLSQSSILQEAITEENGLPVDVVLVQIKISQCFV